MFVFVNMVNYFCRFQKSIKDRFCNNSTFKDITVFKSKRMSRSSKKNITITTKMYSAIPTVMFRATMFAFSIFAYFSFCFFRMFLSVKRIIFSFSCYTYFFANIFRAFTTNSDFVRTLKRATNNFTTFLASRASFKRFVTDWANINHISIIPNGVTFVK